MMVAVGNFSSQLRSVERMHLWEWRVWAAVFATYGNCCFLL